MILCSVGVELLFAFVILINGSVIEEHEIHAAILLKEVPLTFGAAVTNSVFNNKLNCEASSQCSCNK